MIMVFKNRIPVTDFNTVHGSCYTFIHIIWYSMKGASLFGYSIKGTSFLKTCFVHEGWPCWNRQAKIKLKTWNGEFYFVSISESSMRQWRLAGLDVEKKKKKLQVSHLASQLHVGSLILSSGDVSTQLLCPISKRVVRATRATLDTCCCVQPAPLLVTGKTKIIHWKWK